LTVRASSSSAGAASSFAVGAILFFFIAAQAALFSSDGPASFSAARDSLFFCCLIYPFLLKLNLPLSSMTARASLRLRLLVATRLFLLGKDWRCDELREAMLSLWNVEYN